MNYLCYGLLYYAKKLKKYAPKYHGWNSNMNTPGKQYNMTTFLAPL
jgi:hypothetical protein